jgi:hypothetical protein
MTKACENIFLVIGETILNLKAQPQDNLNVREKLRDPPHDYRASGGDEVELLLGVPQPYKPVPVEMQ